MPAIELELPKPATPKAYEEELIPLLGSYLERSRSLWEEAMRWLCVQDLYFLVTEVMSTRYAINKRTGRPIFRRQFIVDRSRELEENEHDVPYVWGRGMGKTTLRTIGRNVQRGLGDPESAGCNFSYQRTAALKPLRAIKTELESNRLLLELFPDVLYENPRAKYPEGSPCWSLKEGLCLKRRTNRPEQTFEAHAFMDGLPTGSHYDRIDWDDVEDDKSVTSPEMIEKLHYTFRQSGNLKVPGVIRCPTGTIYHPQGLNASLLRERQQKGLPVSYYPGEDLRTPGPGPLGGTPSEFYEGQIAELWEWWDELQGSRDPSVYANQVALDYKVASGKRLRADRILRYTQDPMDFGRGCYIYICQDPSKGVSDPTVIWVWGTTEDQKYAWLDCVRGRMEPAERLEATYQLYLKWAQIGVAVMDIRIEEFGQADYIGPTADFFNRRNLAPLLIKCNDNRLSKIARLHERWSHPLAEHRLIFPHRMMLQDEKGDYYDVVEYFLEWELGEFPRPATDDLLDAGSLIWEDPERAGQTIVFPSPRGPQEEEDEEYGLSFLVDGYL